MSDHSKELCTCFSACLLRRLPDRSRSRCRVPICHGRARAHAATCGRRSACAWADAHGDATTAPFIILFIGTNPHDTTRLALEWEIAGIERALRMTRGRDLFELRPRWATSVDDLMRHLNECRPTVVHVGGHGTPGTLADACQPGAPRRDLSIGEPGIWFQDGDRSQPVGAHALAQMIASAAPSTKLVVLNACFSEAMAAALCSVVDCVVAMRGPITDAAARSASAALYGALGNARSVGNAVAQASAILSARWPQDRNLVTCKTRHGLSADELFLLLRGRETP